MKLSIEKRLEFLELINSGTSKSKACKMVGISRLAGDAWLQDFSDKGIPHLDPEPQVRNQCQRKANHKHHGQIVDLALRFP